MPYIKITNKTKWGEITGEINNQVDLVNHINNIALNLPETIIYWGNISGNLSEQNDLSNKFAQYSLIHHTHQEYNNIAPKWGEIIGTINQQNDLITLLSDFSAKNHTHPEYLQINSEVINYFNSHLNNTSNPHLITKEQIGLSNVNDIAQLSRGNNDFYSFDSKATLSDNDILLIEDSEDSNKKKKITMADLKLYLSK